MQAFAINAAMCTQGQHGMLSINYGCDRFERAFVLCAGYRCLPNLFLDWGVGRGHDDVEEVDTGWRLHEALCEAQARSRR
jgi:hypothetical protein